jgi:hypothetical protein
VGENNADFQVHRIRPEFQESRSWCLLHDNEPVHSSGVASEFLAKRGIPVLSHPPYSPGFSAGRLLLLPKLKTAMKGMRFEAVSPIQQIVTRTEGNIGRSAFSGIRFVVNIVQKWAGTTMSDVLKNILSSCGFLWPRFRNLIVTLYILGY